MNNQEKLEFIQNAVVKLFGIKDTLTVDTNLLEIGLDSLDIIELQIYYEESFSCELPDNYEPVMTVGNLMDLM